MSKIQFDNFKGINSMNPGFYLKLKVISKAIIAIVISGIIFMLPTSLYRLYDLFWLGHCDPKFGCIGDFIIIMYISGVFCLISIAALAIAKLVYRVNILSRYYLGITILLGGLHNYFFDILFNGQMDSITVAILWLILSAISYLSVGWMQNNITNNRYYEAN